MATWIGHLRILENLLISIPNIDSRYFAYESLAPDCGRRAEGEGAVNPKIIYIHCAWASGS